MKNLFLILFLCLTVSACKVNTSEFTDSRNFDSFHYMNARLVVKDYDIKGLVEREYQKYCFLFGLFCTKDVFIHHDLMQKAKKLGGNHVLNMVVDKNISSPFWYFLFSKQNYRADALAVKITKTENKIIYGYTE